MIEAKFPAKLRSGGSSTIIGVPKDIIELYGLDKNSLYEICIKKVSFFGFSHRNLRGLEI
jgi:hypothetical protein